MPFWESGIFWGIAGIVGGFIISAFFFAIGRKRKNLEFQVISTDLITDTMAFIPGIQVTIDGKPVRNLISTTVKFKNTGNQIITSDDFAKMEPLSISVTGCFYCTNHVDHKFSDNPNSVPSISILDETNMRIEFDFLKPGQTCSITVLHNGILSVLGDLKDGNIREHLPRKLAQRVTTVLLFVPTVALLSVLYQDPNGRINLSIESIFIIALSALTIYIGYPLLKSLLVRRDGGDF